MSASSYREDMDRVFGSIREVGAELQQDPEWGSLGAGADRSLRVESLDDGFARSACEFKTLPLNQGTVANELRRRLMTTFAGRGIKPSPIDPDLAPDMTCRCRVASAV